jgi:hypothetical protein
MQHKIHGKHIIKRQIITQQELALHGVTKEGQHGQQDAIHGPHIVFAQSPHEAQDPPAVDSIVVKFSNELFRLFAFF